jgi:hypothetical protein
LVIAFDVQGGVGTFRLSEDARARGRKRERERDEILKRTRQQDEQPRALGPGLVPNNTASLMHRHILRPPESLTRPRPKSPYPASAPFFHCPAKSDFLIRGPEAPNDLDTSDHAVKKNEPFGSNLLVL